MLLREHPEEGVAKGPLGALALSWDGDGLVGAGRGLVLDEFLEVVVINVVCMRPSVSPRNGRRRGPRRG